MATTSIWSVKGWLGKVVIYVENPDKTTAPEIAKLPGYEKGEAAQSEEKIQSLSDVIAYALNHLPPQYVVTDTGRMMVKLKNCDSQNRTDVLAALSNAVKLIRDNPRH